jgi:hypothetical protein
VNLHPQSLHLLNLLLQNPHLQSLLLLKLITAAEMAAKAVTMVVDPAITEAVQVTTVVAITAAVQVTTVALLKAVPAKAEPETDPTETIEFIRVAVWQPLFISLNHSVNRL